MVGRQVPEVALHDVQRDAGVEQAGGDRVAESVGAVEVDQRRRCCRARPAERPARSTGSAACDRSRAGRRCGSFCAARNRYFGVVPGAPCSAKYRCAHCCCSRMIATTSASHQDGVGSAVDLRLLVAELGDRCLGVASPAASGCPAAAAGSSGNSGSRSSRQISLTRRPSNATSMVIRMACSSPNPPSATGAPSSSSPAMIWVMASSSMTSPSSRGLRLAGQLPTPVEAGVLRARAAASPVRPARRPPRPCCRP